MKDRIPHQQVPMRPREIVTAQQVSTILSVIGQLYPYVTSDTRIDEPSRVDGGAVAAASVTLANACDRLDAILADTTRWAMDAQDGLEESLKKMYVANTAFLDQQRVASASVVKPSFRFRPSLLRIEGGWTAILGDARNLDACIIGIGTSPQAAIDDFDEKFLGLSPDDVRQFLQQNENQQTVDRDRNQTTGGDAKAGPKRRRNRKASGADKKVD
jgi:hypothetical protein